MDLTPSIQDFQKLQAETAVIAAVVTMLLSLAGRWIGGVWTTLLSIAGCVLFAYQPLVNTTLFSNLKTDRLQMIIVGLIPFVLITIGLSFRKIPLFVHVIFAIIGPALVLGWAYHDYDVSEARMALFLHGIAPISIAIFILWLLLEPIAARSPGFALPMVIAVLAIASTFLLMLSKDQNAGLMSTPVSGTAIGAALAAIASGFIGKKQLSFTRGPTLLWLTVLGLMFGYLWISDDSMPLKYLYWLAAVPVVAWIPELGPIHRLKPWNREAIRFLVMVIPASIAMTLAFKDHKAEAKASGDEYGLHWPAPHPPYPAAPISPSQMPIPNTINPPMIT
jgi:hypothetical protein